MASAITHAFVAVAAGKAYAAKPMPWRFWAAAVAASVLPDADYFGYAWGIPYGSLLGHRGLSHALFFAVLWGFASALWACRDAPRFSGRWTAAWIFFSAVTASHGVLDAMTDGGLGVAFFSPFSNGRYFFPWTPVPVSPLGVPEFFTGWGLRVLAVEFVVVWIPCGLVALAVRLWRAQPP